CHSGNTPKGKLNLSRREAALRGGESGAAIVPGRPDESFLWEQVESGAMPPKAALTESERQVLRRWIADGALWRTDPVDPDPCTSDRRAGREWWALPPLAGPVVPVVAGAANPIDAFVGKKLQDAGLRPSPKADRRALVRRLTFDLIGLPPPEEVDAFVRDDR